MSKFMNMIENIVPDAQAVLRRFPLATLMVLALTIIVIIQANDHNFFSDDTMMRLVGGVVLGAYISVILTLVGEGRGRAVPFLIKALCVGAVMLLSWFFREIAYLPPMAIGASVLFLGSSPFWRQKRDDVAVWDFTHKIWSAVIFTSAGAFIYMIGMFAISEALKSLFGLNIRNFVQDWLFPIGFAFLAPMAWMSMVPAHDEDDTDSLRNPGFISRAVGFLGTWILAPLTIIYAVILLAYAAKILITLTLPNGEIAQLVTPFLIVGTLTWLILDPPFIQEKRLARWFSKTWFWFMMPAAILLVIAVFVRIGEYGWTIERYLLVLASVWALGIAGWFTFRNEAKRDIRIIPGFAALLLAIGSIGPWGADGFSVLSQNSRLEKGLKANDMLGNDGRLKLKGAIEIKDKEAAQSARGALNYLLKHKKKSVIAKYINVQDKIDLEVTDNNSRLSYDKITKSFGLENITVPNRYNKFDNSVNYNAGHSVIPVQGYEYISTRQNQNLMIDGKGHANKIKLGDYEVTASEGNIIVRRGMEELSRTDMMKWLEGLGLGIDNSGIAVPNLVLYSQDNVEITLNLTQASYSRDDEVRNFAFIEYMLLTKGIKMNGATPNP